MPFIITIASVFMFALFGFASCSERIDAGHEGILVNSYGSDKGVSDATLVTGRVFYNPMTQDVLEYPIFVQTKDYEAFQVNAKDGSMFTVDPTVAYRVTAGRSPDIYRKYRKSIQNFTDAVMLNYVKDAFRVVLNKYSTDEILYKRSEIESEITKTLTETVGKDGVTIDNLTSGLKYPESIVSAITQKNAAVQEAQKVENELKITEANARKIKVQAEAEAQQVLIKARAESEANALKQKTLTRELIQQQMIEKWDGKLPVYSETPELFRQVSSN